MPQHHQKPIKILIKQTAKSARSKSTRQNLFFIYGEFVVSRFGAKSYPPRAGHHLILPFFVGALKSTKILFCGGRWRRQTSGKEEGLGLRKRFAKISPPYMGLFVYEIEDGVFLRIKIVVI